MNDQLLAIKASNDSLSKLASIEKIYLQFDKPYYALSDTIWFKAYLLNSFLTASEKSGIINIDIANDSNRVVKQYRFPIKAGLGGGNISLDEKEYKEGSYTLRAWTQWMRNRGDADFYYKQFHISSTGEHNWLVGASFKNSVANNSYLADASLQFSNMDKTLFAGKTLQLVVMNSNKELYKKTMQTDEAGRVDVNFTIPQKTSKLAVVVQSEKKDKKAVIPVPLNRPENTDVQFMPEGGELIAGLPAHIGFKAIGYDGRGINVSGTITDKEQKTVAVFNSVHNGMGSFVMDVRSGESYMAKVELPDGAIKNYTVPAVKTSGTILQVKNQMQGDSLNVIAAVTDDIAQSNRNYFLIGKARGIICYAAVVSFTKENSVFLHKIAKNLFPSGITHFILMTTSGQPLNERLVYIDHRDGLNIRLKANKPSYVPHDSVALQLNVTDASGKPVAANFSLAITDDGQLKNDSLNSDNIITRMLLTGDLKGYIEMPGYYTGKGIRIWQALDDLLLTQGWTSYQPEGDQPEIRYPAEREFTVTGKVTNVFGKPLKKTDVLLFSKSPAILMDTTTDNEGRFIFDRFPKVDAPVFIVRAVNRNGKSFNVNVDVDEIKPPIFMAPPLPAIIPWYVNSDTTLLNYIRTEATTTQQQYLSKNGHMLREVKITGQKIVKGSQNLNGPGNADVILDEKDLEKAQKKNWLQLLEENVKDFREMELPPRYPRWYYLHFKAVFFIIDGIFFTDVYPSFDFLTLKTYLQSHTAEDIKGLEVMSSDAYAAKYSSRFFPRSSLGNFAFVEITTRAGHGPIIDNTPGMYLYKPLPISYPKQFYKPKYTVKDTTAHLPDLRSTIDWEPNVVTDENGEAKIWFYTADKPSTYTVIIEGADMHGSLGYKTGRIVVKPLDEKTK
ncbi:MAG TPA: carboxypeptidase-like regulatory domain-containing protein [Mucilaginibacter sp.]|nr:carboxypeptidase-like regulatory domain-containing protein [Mucilaginibacter sp.]